MLKGKKKLATLVTVCVLAGSTAMAAGSPAAVPVRTVPVRQSAPVSAGTSAIETWRTQKQLAQEETMALLWMRSAAEYRALCYQGYNAAMMEVDKALSDPARKGKPLAIVLDCDETVTDNTPALAKAAADGNGQYKSIWWRDVVHEGKSGAMPGAVDFLQQVDKKGLAIFYVSNRYAPVNYEATEANLKALRFPQADKKHILLMEKSGNKQLRFNTITADYDVVVYMGDNAGDLPIGTNGKSLTERNQIVDAHKADFGTKYIVFPNPVYGAWVSAIAKNYLTMTPEQRDEVNREFLTKNY